MSVGGTSNTTCLFFHCMVTFKKLKNKKDVYLCHPFSYLRMTHWQEVTAWLFQEHFRVQMCQSEPRVFEARAPKQASQRHTSNPLILWTFWLNYIDFLRLTSRCPRVSDLLSLWSTISALEFLCCCWHPALNLRQKCDQKWTREKHLFAELSTTTSCCFIEINSQNNRTRRVKSSVQHLSLSEVRHHLLLITGS